MTAAPSVVAAVEARCAAIPDAVAVVDDTGELTYGRLWSLAGHYATQLRRCGVGAGDNVAIAASRSASFVVGVLAILRIGAAYVPLDLAYPVERLRLMVELAGVRVIVTGEGAVGRSPSIGVARKVDLGDMWEVTPAEVSLPEVVPGDCYVMFTSGSTGVPKGVVHGHASLVNLLAWQARDSDCGIGSRTALFAPTSFDVSFQEIFATLCTGGVLVCVNEGVRSDPDALWSVLAERAVQRLFLPAVALQLLAEFAPEDLAEGIVLTEVITAGEQLVVTPRLRWMFARLGDCRLVNQYGPTETHVVTQFTLPADPRTWRSLPPIGRPIDGVRIHIVDDRLDDVAPGEVGEIAASGAALSKGYVGGADSERFVTLSRPDGDTPVYRTGDLGFVDDGGDLHFGGRADDQVKIQGYRVECGEVEAALLGLPNVRSCVVVPVGATAVERELEASVVVSDAVDVVTLRRRLEQLLPGYMVPARIRLVATLPVASSGKVDRRRAGTLSLTAKTMPMNEGA